MHVTVDCPSCSGLLQFGDRACDRCGTTVPSELRDALETRLEAASPEFRDLKSSARGAALLLLVIAVGHAFFGVMLYWIGTASDLAGGAEEQAVARSLLVTNLANAAMFFGCYKWAQHRPVSGLAASIALLVAIRVVATVVSPLSLIAGLWVNLVLLLILGRGLWSARKATRLAKQFQRQ